MNTLDTADGPHDDYLKKVENAVRGIRHGRVEIIVQDSRVIQINKLEKVRLDERRARRPAAGR